MNKIQELKESMLIKNENICLGEIWHNQRIDILFKDVKYNKFNYELLLFIKDLMTQKYHNDMTVYNKDYFGKITMDSSDILNKGHIIKLNSIMKSKTKKTLEKRIYSFGNLLTSSYYQQIFEVKRNKQFIDFFNKHKLDLGLKY